MFTVNVELLNVPSNSCSCHMLGFFFPLSKVLGKAVCETSLRADGTDFSLLFLG